MKTIDEYCDIAISRNGLRSDRDLAKRVGCSPAVPSQWRTRRSWPADHIMIRLAQLAGIDEAEALMDLAIWRTSEEARPVYERLLKMVTKSAMGVLFAYSLTSGHTNIAYASTTASEGPTAEVTQFGSDCIL